MFVLVAQAASQPTAPTISVARLSSSSIQVTLVTPSTEPTYGIGSYTLYFGTNSTGPFTAIPSILSGAFPYTLSGLNSSTLYYLNAAGIDQSANTKASPHSATVSATTSASSGTAHLFPRPGSYAIGFGTGGTVAGQTIADRAAIAKMKVAVLGVPGENYAGLAMTRDQVIQDIKSRALANGYAQYTIQYAKTPEFKFTRANDPYPNLWDINTANNWWMYVGGAGTSGTKSVSKQGSTFGWCNYTHFAPVDPSTGLFPGERAALYFKNLYLDGTYGAANVSTHIDAIFQDGVFITPSYGTSSIDMSRNGTTTNINNTTSAQQWRQGQQDFNNKWVTLTGKAVGSNTAQWGEAPSGPNLNDPTTLSPYNNGSSHSVMENLLGQYQGGPSVEVSGSPTCMAWYNFMQSTLTTDPATGQSYNIIMQSINADGSDGITTSPPWQAARAGQGFVAMGNGYWFGAVQGGAGYQPSLLVDPDEMFGGALNDRNWLGAAIDPPQTAFTLSGGVYHLTTYQQAGVMKREFQFGTVLYWFSGTASVTLPYNTQAFTGTQAPSVNNGASFSAGTAIGPPGGTTRNALFLRKV